MHARTFFRISHASSRRRDTLSKNASARTNATQARARTHETRAMMYATIATIATVPTRVSARRERVSASARGLTTRPHAGTGAAHEGIVDDALVHSSSLASCGFAPKRDGAATVTAAATAVTAAVTAAAESAAVTAAAESAAMTMWTSATCPFAHRPWLTLVELQAPHALKVENLENKSDAFKTTFASAAPDAAGNPSVPILEHDGAIMVESALVMKYIVDVFGASSSTNLVPRSAQSAYYGQLFADTFQSCVPLYFKMLRAMNDEELAEAKTAFIGGLKKANRCLELAAKVRGDGPYVCGEQFTTCDITAMTFVPRFEIVLGHYRGFNFRVALKENGCEALENWVAAVSSRPSMVYTLGEIEKMTNKSVADAFIAHFAKFVKWQPDVIKA